MEEDKQTWAGKMTALLDEQLEGVREQEIQFLRIVEFGHFIKLVEKNMSDCNECLKFKAEIEDIIPKINTILLHPGKPRKQYDKLIDRLAKHFRSMHQIYPALYFTYLYTAIGMAAGFLIGMMVETIRWLLVDKISWELWVGVVIIGLLIGHVKGVKKDAFIRKKGKLL